MRNAVYLVRTFCPRADCLCSHPVACFTSRDLAEEFIEDHLHDASRPEVVRLELDPA